MDHIDHVREEHRRVQTACLLVLTFIAVGVALWVLKPVLVPFALAMMFAWVLTPLIDIQIARFRLPRLAAIISTAILALIVLSALGFLAAISIGQLSGSFGAYQAQLDQLISDIMRAVSRGRYGGPAAQGAATSLRIPESAISGFLASVLSEVTGIVSSGVLVLIFVMFILAGRGLERKPPAGLLAEVELRVRQYLVQMVVLSALTGILVAGILASLGVPFALAFGFLAALLNFIPTLGSIIATLLPLPLVLLSPDLSPASKVLAIALPAAMQFVLGSIVQPRIQGAALNLHPIAILMALIFFGMIWGPVGTFLATPITAVIKIVLDHIPATRLLADLLAGDLEKLHSSSSTQTGERS